MLSPGAQRYLLLFVPLVALCASGCATLPVATPPPETPVPPGNPIPRELEKTALPPYILEPPDILFIEAVRVVPKPPITIRTQDVILVVVPPEVTGFDQPIGDNYPVDVDGTVNLGPAYGKVRVVDMTLEEATQAVFQHLQNTLRNVTSPDQVSISLVESAGQQQITGEHLVGPDGTVNLGTYGSVFVSGMTLAQAKAAIEEHLAQFLDEPEVSVDVFSYNSKVYYVVVEGAGQGDQIAAFPITGNETVLDALSQLQSTGFGTTRNVWVARPSPHGLGYSQVLPVCWEDMIRGGISATNYQLFPGDRVIIREDRLVAFDTMLSKITTPIERIFGVTLLGSQTVQTINRLPDGLRGATGADLQGLTGGLF